MIKKPYSIRVFLPGGDPDGVRTIEKSNWSGFGIVIPRALFDESKRRKELARTGVYVLIGTAEESGLPRIYVGEGDPIRPRLEQHAMKKDFWTSCIAFTSKDENLNKAHVQHIESKLVELASSAKRCELDNGNEPNLPSLSDADAADADGFLSEMLLCFPLLGVNAFAQTPGAKAAGKVLTLSAKSISARGSETPDGFVVFCGSGASGKEVDSCPTYVRQLRATLISKKVLVAKGEDLVFTQDYLFGSPSTAASVLKARSTNGREAWISAEGKTLKELQGAGA